MLGSLKSCKCLNLCQITFLSVAIVTYQTVVSGKTFGAHKELIEKVTHQCQNRVRLIDSSDDAKITIVFCPITSRILSDVEAAMADVKGKGKMFQPVHIEIEIAYHLLSFCELGITKFFLIYIIKVKLSYQHIDVLVRDNL